MQDNPLPPWNRLPYFNQPIETTYLLNSSATQIAKGDPQRVLMVIGIAGNNLTPPTVTYPIPIAYGIQAATVQLPTIVISTSPLVSQSQGFVLSPLGIPLVLNFRDWGLALTLPWYAVFAGPVAPSLTVITQSMRAWPGDAGVEPSLIDVADSGVLNDPSARRTAGNGRAKLYSDRWGEQQEVSPHGLPRID